MPAVSNWTPERVELFTALWASGKSCAAIGSELGLTKGSVLGKARRLNLPSRTGKERLPSAPRGPITFTPDATVPAYRPERRYQVVALPVRPITTRQASADIRRIMRELADPARKDERTRAVHAGVLHLLDLKLAGHSPYDGELNIPPGGETPALFIRQVGKSMTGSPAAMCAAN